ncbi:MAG: DUF1572 family protein [Bryobacteraceae bacterium]
MPSLERVFVETVERKLTQMCARIGACLDRLNAEQVWMRGGEHENAIGNLVLHLCGNVRQWIGHGVGGQTDVRERDGEFDARSGADPAELKARLTAAVNDALAVIRALDAEGLGRVIEVQGYSITVLEAVLHVTEHFSQHAGQIFLLTKHATGEDLGFYRHLGRKVHAEKTP